jgi:hypothetical protein
MGEARLVANVLAFDVAEIGHPPLEGGPPRRALASVEKAYQPNAGALLCGRAMRKCVRCGEADRSKQ